MMTITEIKHQTLQNLANSLELSIHYLKSKLPASSDKYAALILLEARYNDINKNTLLGIVSAADMNLELNKLRKALLDFAKDLEEQDLDPQSTENESGKRYRKGKVLYRIPRQMQVDVEERCMVRVAINEEILLEDLEKNGEDAVRNVRVARLMSVELLDSNEYQPFSIRPISDEVQFFEQDDFTEWIFYVSPKLTGKFRLALKIAVIQMLEGQERKKDVVLEEVVVITAEPPESPEEGVPWQDANIPFLIMAGGASGPGTTAPTLPAPSKGINSIISWAIISFLVFGLVTIKSDVSFWIKPFGSLTRFENLPKEIYAPPEPIAVNFKRASNIVKPKINDKPRKDELPDYIPVTYEALTDIQKTATIRGSVAAQLPVWLNRRDAEKYKTPITDLLKIAEVSLYYAGEWQPLKLTRTGRFEATLENAEQGDTVKIKVQAPDYQNYFEEWIIDDFEHTVEAGLDRLVLPVSLERDFFWYSKGQYKKVNNLKNRLTIETSDEKGARSSVNLTLEDSLLYVDYNLTKEATQVFQAHFVKEIGECPNKAQGLEIDFSLEIDLNKQSNCAFVIPIEYFQTDQVSLKLLKRSRKTKKITSLKHKNARIKVKLENGINIHKQKFETDSAGMVNFYFRARKERYSDNRGFLGIRNMDPTFIPFQSPPYLDCKQFIRDNSTSEKRGDFYNEDGFILTAPENTRTLTVKIKRFLAGRKVKIDLTEDFCDISMDSDQLIFGKQK